ncbi:hypothetical protein DPMN_180084 [Dreissena polymorpha]|uniref:Uncharacterized protein n=1 Tax=Dreissena polymorpha TaxID=45954 RepID=A0A9D4EFM0_DREPO|nr:hypothetical protein DPMN_180084 [Dreissena polymorpha]
MAMGPCIAEIDRIVIIDFQGAIANSVGGDIVPVDLSINLKEDGNRVAFTFIIGPGIDRVVIRDRRAPGLLFGPCIVDIDRIFVRDVQYQFEVNRCRNEGVNFQGSSANSAGGYCGQDGRADGGQTTISPRFLKRGDN